MDHILCLGRQYQKIAMESSIIKIESHTIPHFKADKFCHIYLSHTYCFYDHNRLGSYQKVKGHKLLLVLWPLTSLDMHQFKHGNEVNKYAMKTYSTLYKL